MKNKRKFLSFEERQNIEELLKNHKSLNAISRIIKRSASTVIREVARNGGRYCYKAEKAQGFYQKDINLKKFDELIKRIENLEMQIEIVTDTIKKIRKI